MCFMNIVRRRGINSRESALEPAPYSKFSDVQLPVNRLLRFAQLFAMPHALATGSRVVRLAFSSLECPHA